jgi:hypothetical protein
VKGSPHSALDRSPNGCRWTTLLPNTNVTRRGESHEPETWNSPTVAPNGIEENESAKCDAAWSDLNSGSFGLREARSRT